MSPGSGAASQERRVPEPGRLVTAIVALACVLLCAHRRGVAAEVISVAAVQLCRRGGGGDGRAASSHHPARPVLAQGRGVEEGEAGLLALKRVCLCVRACVCVGERVCVCVSAPACAPRPSPPALGHGQSPSIPGWSLTVASNVLCAHRSLVPFVLGAHVAPRVPNVHRPARVCVSPVSLRCTSCMAAGRCSGGQQALHHRNAHAEARRRVACGAAGSSSAPGSAE